jgi:hypothetical protein
MTRLSEVLDALYVAFTDRADLELDGEDYYRGYREAINDVSKIVLHVDLEKKGDAE